MSLFIFLPNCYASCEAYWISNISSIYGSSENLSEPLNAVSSLTYTLFGIIGLILNNYSNMYYLLMNLFILTGLASFLHHYYYSNADWAYSADLITMKALGTFSLLYIICDNEYYKFKFINKLLNLIIITGCVLMLINYDWRLLFKINVITIITTQCLICIYFFIIKSTLKFRVLLSSLWNGILFSVGYLMWNVDIECPQWMFNSKFNGHAIWHLFVACALFNAINITNVSRYTFNETKFTWKSLFKKLPWFLYLITVSTERSNTIDNYTSIDLHEVKCLMDKSHRRVNTIS